MLFGPTGVSYAWVDIVVTYPHACKMAGEWIVFLAGLLRMSAVLVMGVHILAHIGDMINLLGTAEESPAVIFTCRF